MTGRAVTCLNFKGDITKGVMIGQAMGPNTMGEWLFVVDATYDEDQDTTRVGFSYAPVKPRKP